MSRSKASASSFLLKCLLTRYRKSVRDLMKLFGNLEDDAEGNPYIIVDNPDPRGGFRADRDDEGYADDL